MLASRSALFAFECVTGVHHPAENLPSEAADFAVICKLKKRLLGKVLVQTYLTSVENEKAAHGAL